MSSSPSLRPRTKKPATLLSSPALSSVTSSPRTRARTTPRALNNDEEDAIMKGTESTDLVSSPKVKSKSPSRTTASSDTKSRGNQSRRSRSASPATKTTESKDKAKDRGRGKGKEEAKDDDAMEAEEESKKLEKQSQDTNMEEKKHQSKSKHQHHQRVDLRQTNMQPCFVHRCRFVDWKPFASDALSFNLSGDLMACARKNGNIEIWSTKNQWTCELVSPCHCHCYCCCQCPCLSLCMCFVVSTHIRIFSLLSICF